MHDLQSINFINFLFRSPLTCFFLSVSSCDENSVFVPEVPHKTTPNLDDTPQENPNFNPGPPPDLHIDWRKKGSDKLFGGLTTRGKRSRPNFPMTQQQLNSYRKQLNKLFSQKFIRKSLLDVTKMWHTYHETKGKTQNSRFIIQNSLFGQLHSQ